MVTYEAGVVRRSGGFFLDFGSNATAPVFGPVIEPTGHYPLFRESSSSSAGGDDWQETADHLRSLWMCAVR